jgi:protein arginine kinase activator
MKCQKCPKAATFHITDIVSEEQVEERHLCEECAQKFLNEPEPKAKTPSAVGTSEEAEEPGLLNRECEVCGIKFADFRNSGRLGCPHDYQQFRDDLLPLLENIHGETKHCGKTPRRLPQSKQKQAELVQLRKQLMQAVHREAYEDAARLRDKIRQVEES